jgi:secreted Zn-dependent insulinase-like peptidase
MGFIFSVQGEAKEPNYVSERTVEFVKKYEKIFADTAEQEFVKLKKSTEINLTQKPLTLEDEADEIFSGAIMTHLYTKFDAKEHFKKRLAGLSKETVLGVYREIFLGRQAVLEVHMVSQGMKDGYLKALAKREFKAVDRIKRTVKHMGKLHDLYRFRADDC